MAKKKPSDLGRRERQIMDVIYQIGEASVSDVLSRLPDPPSYSSVRTMIRLLESKELLKHRRVGTKYVYRPTQKRETVRRSALDHLITTFFGGSPADTIATILGDHTDSLTEQDLDRLEEIIEKARSEGES